MGREELVRHLIGSAERRREEILRQAREEAERRIAQARARADEMERESREFLEREAARERDLRMSRARLEANAALLRARASLAEEILGRLRERLSRLPAEACYPQVAERLFGEILPEIPAGTIALGADPKALEALAPMVSEPRFRRVPLPEEELGGVEVSDDAGEIRIRNTLRARLEIARPALMAEIHRSLAAADE
jgi:vacuolar-type H+-ATPase subunit E/Vma4